MEMSTLTPQMIEILKDKYTVEIDKDESVDVIDNSTFVCTLYDQSDFFKFIYKNDKFMNDTLESLYNQIVEGLSFH